MEKKINISRFIRNKDHVSRERNPDSILKPPYDSVLDRSKIKSILSYLYGELSLEKDKIYLDREVIDANGATRKIIYKVDNSYEENAKGYQKAGITFEVSDTEDSEEDATIRFIYNDDKNICHTHVIGKKVGKEWIFNFDNIWR